MELFDSVKGLLSEGTDFRFVLVAAAVIAYYVVKAVLGILREELKSRKAEREKKDAELSARGQEMYTLASNHIAHLQEAMEASQREFLASQKEIVRQQVDAAQSQAETVRALGALSERVKEGFERQEKSLERIHERLDDAGGK